MEDAQVQITTANNRHPTYLLVGLVLLGLVDGSAVWAGEPLMRIEMDKQRPHVAFLSWDTEGGSRAETNLLRPGQPVRLRMRSGEQGKPGEDLRLGAIDTKPSATTYRLAPAPAVELFWHVSPASASLAMTFTKQGAGTDRIEGIELLVPFDPCVTPTTVLPSRWDEDGSCRLPAVINAPDFGQMLLSESDGQRLKARLEGSRAEKIVDLTVELPPLKSGRA
jgi:hypothetical protein